jgi:hypothetical protein
METKTGENAGNAGDEQVADPLAGTPFKSVDEMAKGYAALHQKLGEQGNELGQYKKHAETLAQTLQTVAQQRQPAAEAPPANDYAKERAAVQKEIKNLDPLGDRYQESLAGLVDRLTSITAMDQHEKTLSAAKNVFQKELEERDVRSTQKQFFDQHPDFNTPEMQGTIKEYLAKDQTGMHDPFSAYFQIQADTLALAKQQTEQENVELKKLVELNKGKDQTGKVITKGQSPGQPTTQHAKVTGRALEDGMRQALANLQG